MEHHVHPEPLWRSRADFVFGARLEEAGHREQLWGRRLDSGHLEVCCIPLFVYGLALGDVVEIDDDFMLVGIVERSGRSVLRAYGDEGLVVDTANRLRALGCGVEFGASKRLISVDCETPALAKTAAALLAELERNGGLTYETGE